MRPNEVEVTLPPDDLEPVYLLGRVETPCGSEVLALWQAAEALMAQDLAGHPDSPTAFAEIE